MLMVHAFNPSPGEAGQPGLHRETPSEKNKKTEQNKIKNVFVQIFVFCFFHVSIL